MTAKWSELLLIEPHDEVRTEFRGNRNPLLYMTRAPVRDRGLTNNLFLLRCWMQQQLVLVKVSRGLHFYDAQLAVRPSNIARYRMCFAGR